MRAKYGLTCICSVTGGAPLSVSLSVSVGVRFNQLGDHSGPNHPTFPTYNAKSYSVTYGYDATSKVSWHAGHCLSKNLLVMSVNAYSEWLSQNEMIQPTG